MQNYLNSIKGIGLTNVTRSQDCAGYKWTVKWLTGGDKPLMSLVNKNIKNLVI